MPIQRESDTEQEENESISELPVVIPKYQVSQAKLDHLARARARKAEIAQQKAEERAKAKEETTALSRGVKKIKDPVSKEVVKKEILKATALRQPKQETQPTPPPPPTPPPTPQPTQNTRKPPKIVVEESEPEVIFVKRPKKKIVIEETATETETEPEVKPKRKPRKPRVPVETESESEYDVPQKPVKKPLKPPTQFPYGFQINF